MRQGFFAGLIVAFVGLPLAIVANGKEFARECGALAAAAQGNLAPVKAIWFPAPAVATDVAQTRGEIDNIQRWGAWAVAQQLDHPDTIIKRQAAGFDLGALIGRDPSAGANAGARFVHRRLAEFGEVASAAVASGADASNGGAIVVSEAPRSLFGSVVDGLSIAAYADELGPATTPSKAGSVNRVVASLTDSGHDKQDAVGAAAPADIAASNAGSPKSDGATTTSGFVDVTQVLAAEGGFASPTLENGGSSGFTDLGGNSH